MSECRQVKLGELVGKQAVSVRHLAAAAQTTPQAGGEEAH